MGIDFNDFQNRFFDAMKNVAAMDGDIKQIDTDSEVAKAKDTYIEFRSEATMSQPIGDIADVSNTAKAENKNNEYKPNQATGEATVEDLMAFLDDVDIAKVEEYNKIPVTTLNAAVTTPIEAKRMAALAEGVDMNKLNAYLDMGYQSDTAARIGGFTELEAEDQPLAYMIGVAYGIG